MALYDLYLNNNGEHWTWDDWRLHGNPWNFSDGVNPCTDHWQGIRCNYTNSYQEVHVTLLGLLNHNLTGTIPESIGNLTHLTGLGLDINHLHGTIPACIGTNMPNLTDLSLTENLLNGTIPAWIGNLSHLEFLGLADNLFTGPVPASLSRLSHLKDLNIAENQLTGQLPESLGNLTNLKVLYTFSNAFTGPIPAFVCDLIQLEYMAIYLNHHHGKIPPCFGDLSSLIYLMIYGNDLTGPLPPEIGQLSTLQQLWIGENRLTGTIPNTLGGLTSLLQFISFQNLHTGPLPESIGSMPKLIYLEVNNNTMSGAVPETIGDSSKFLEQLILDHNFFSQQLPGSIGKLRTVTDLYLGDNCFSGTIPAEFSQLSGVDELFLSHNKLSGTLDNVFNASNQVNLTNVQIDYNQLTGTLPDELFRVAQLNTFVAVSNCLTGALPVSICENTQLVSLILDGFQSAPACRAAILPTVSKSYIVHDKHQGSIPECLFTMPSLTSLHVSGNGLKGTLPNVLSLGERLVDLKVSYNSLTGTVPRAFQEFQWKNLDLSYNRFTGKLLPSFASKARDLNLHLGHITIHYNLTNASLVLQNNRLSGRVPGSMVHQKNISVLGTNLFTCEIDKSDLPGSDENHANYECASDSFNLPFYVMIGLVFIVAVVALIGFYNCQLKSLPSVNVALEWVNKWALDYDNLPCNFKYVCNMSDILCKLSVWFAVLIVVVLVPWYTAASFYYGTYEEQYAWTVSAAFLSGPVVAGVEIFFYLSLILAFVVSLGYLLVQYGKCTPEGVTADVVARQLSEEEVKPRLSKQSRFLVYVVFLSVNVIFVLSVNVAFVYVALYESNTALLLAQLFLSLFKLFWNNFAAPFLLRFIANHVSSLTADFVTIQIIVALFNNIAIPCLVVAVVSPSCFNSVFRAPAAVSALYTYEQCTTFSSASECILYTPTVQSTSFDPPFLYDYQCSSSLITYYGPAFVYLAIAAAFGTPLVKFMGERLHQRATPGTYWYMLLDTAVPRILRPISHIYDNRTSNDEVSRQSESLRNTFAISYDTLKRNMFHPYFDANMFIISLLTYLGILLTFGVVFPPLALAMSFTMISVAWQAKLAVGRFLYQARELRAHKFVDIIELECKGAVTIRKISRSVFIIICFSCTFYALFLFDTLGDAVGLGNAYWVLIFMPLFPILIYAVIRYLREHQGLLAMESPVQKSTDTDQKGFKMSPLASLTAAFHSGKAPAESGASSASKKVEEEETFNALQA